MAIYYILSLGLSVFSYLAFIYSIYIVYFTSHSSGRNWGALGLGYALFLTFAFLTVVSIHGGIVGLVYSRYNPQSYVTISIWLQFLIPASITLSVIVSNIKYNIETRIRREMSVKYAIEKNDPERLKKAAKLDNSIRPPYNIIDHRYVEENIKNGLSAEMTDILIAASGGLAEHHFFVAVSSNRHDLWPVFFKKLLLDKSADDKDVLIKKILGIAVKNQNFKAIDKFFEKYAKKTMDIAIDQAELTVIKYLHQQGTDISHSKDSGTLAYIIFKSKKSLYFSQRKFFDFVTSSGISISKKSDIYGVSPLMASIKANYGSIAMRLLNKNAPLFDTDNNGETALHYTYRYLDLNQNKDFFELLSEKYKVAGKSNVSDKNSVTIDFLCAKFLKIDSINKIIDRIDLSYKDNNGNSFIHYFFQNFYIDRLGLDNSNIDETAKNIISAYKKADIDFNSRNNNGFSAFELALISPLRLSAPETMLSMGFEFSHINPHTERYFIFDIIEHCIENPFKARSFDQYADIHMTDKIYFMLSQIKNRNTLFKIKSELEKILDHYVDKQRIDSSEYNNIMYQFNRINEAGFV